MVNNVANFGNNNVTYGENSDIRVTNGTPVSEISLAVSEMIEELPLKERSELILMIYKFYDEYKEKKK